MTGEEEMVLRVYLKDSGEIEDDETSEAWYIQRFEDIESESHYKHTLQVA